jgi:hypothetical protein
LGLFSQTVKSLNSNPLIATSCEQEVPPKPDAEYASGME